MATLDPLAYTVAWIAPLEIEAKAAQHMLDNCHVGRFPLSRGDDYVFQAGDICGHNVIIATFPAGQEYGTGSAAALASQIKRFFPNLWFGLLVGIAAGLPNLSKVPPNDIRLGDVLVALPDGDTPAVVAYDLGKVAGYNCFQVLRGGYCMGSSETVVRSAIGSIKLYAPNEGDMFLKYYLDMKAKYQGCNFSDPGQARDKLFQYQDDGEKITVNRPLRPVGQRTRVWYGPIGSGDKLVKNSQRRNELRDRHNIIGLEMEAAGIMNRIPVGVIRGVCDYGDDWKSKEWQPYAAAMAAAYAKAVLWEISPAQKVTAEPCGLPKNGVPSSAKPFSGFLYQRRSGQETSLNGRTEEIESLSSTLSQHRATALALRAEQAKCLDPRDMSYLARQENRSYRATNSDETHEHDDHEDQPSADNHDLNNPKVRRLRELGFTEIRRTTLDLHSPFHIGIGDSGPATFAPEFKVQENPEKFFTTGRIFALLWRKHSALTGKNGTIISVPCVGLENDFPVYAGIRRMVVLRETKSCITTYNNRGLVQPGINILEHTILYVKGSEPHRLAEEPRMTNQPLEVALSGPDITLSPMARLNFGKVYTVEHNVAVRPVGRITDCSMPLFQHYAKCALSDGFS
ncbi:hypothetical protein CNMCM5623_007810 [Aspergillus felis]|uniref:DUF6590 domain-containing protein n=1 Tax=Aspergillus felis TaxID=1287682 RepID=A0A8H6PYJ5_9EURO|nr:hypothetical protein CNMCM5623_007810 [Aspergillus felis]